MKNIFLYLKKIGLYLLIVNITILIFVACSKPEIHTHYLIKNFDKEWSFILDTGRTFNQADLKKADWKQIDLPHDWSIHGEFNKDNPTGAREAFLPAGMGWYRKTFTIAEQYKSSIISIRFDGIYRNSTIWLNGHLLGNRPNGYVEVSYDLTPFLYYGDQLNIIEVKVNNSAQPNSRWYTGSGIYRHVWLEYTGNIHFDKWGIQITTSEIYKNNAVISMKAGIKNEKSNFDNLTLQTLIFDPEGKKIIDREFESKVKPGNIDYQVHELEIPNPELWSPDDPKVYKVKNMLKKGKIILDSKTTVIGIRKFKFDSDKGFSLNGKTLKIKGVCLHSAAGAVGAAVPEGILEYRLKKLKDLGCNAIRFSHNPASPEVLNMCDTLGFMVMTEAFDEWEMKKNWGPDYGYHIYFDEWHKQDLSEMIRRDFNHPSIILYSIGNEIQEQRDAIPRGAEIARELVAICHQEDPTRPVTAACDQIPNANKTGFAQALDIVGYNYQDEYYKVDHQKYPNRIILGSETHQFPQTWSRVKNNDFVAGEFLWVGFDYLGEADKFPLKGWENGMFDLTGNIKPRGLLRRTLWNEEPQVYIFSQDPNEKKDISVFAPWSWEKLQEHWNWPELMGNRINVKCYTNCDEVELFLDGKSLGVKELSDINELPLTWTLEYKTGKLKAVAKINGEIVAKDELKTSGKAIKLLLKSSKERIRNNDSDVSVIQVNVVDKDGTTVPDARQVVRFKLEGNAEIIAVDNGDLRSNDSFQGNQRKAFKGKAICIVKAVGSGKIKITATSDGLETASIFINDKTE
jgi:beta-galactosidase